MRVLLLSDPNSSHTIKWVTSLSERGIKILLFGFAALNVRDYEGNSNVIIKTLNQHITKEEGALHKLAYLKALPVLHRIIREFKPDILHAHYATSYGLLGRLSGFHPFVLSVWGGDVFSFPRKSFLHAFLLRQNLKHADQVLSTSHVMAQEIHRYAAKEITVIPFGVDTNRFRPFQTKSSFSPGSIVIGTVKTLEETYGIDHLIKAFAIVKERHPTLDLRLMVVGSGSMETTLQQLCKELKIDHLCVFTGAVPYAEVPKYHNMLDIEVFLSNSESFGVAVVEAQSCAKPVVVSDVEGLPEVVVHDQTGIVVPPADPLSAADAIERLVLSPQLRRELGTNGRDRAIHQYEWERCVDQMLRLYHQSAKTSHAI